MKQIISTLFIAGMCFAACTPSAESVKKDCLKNEDFAVFYGDKLENYCSCVEQKLQEVEKTMPLHDTTVQNAQQSCAVEFTTLDTNF